MKTKLDKFLNENRLKLDVDQPDDVVWEGIRNGVFMKKRRRQRYVLTAAATVLIVLGTAFLYFAIPLKYNQHFALYQVDKELGKSVKAYTKLVNSKTKQAKINRGKFNNEIVLFLVNELNTLDTLYNEAITELRRFGYMEEIVEVIFDTYEKRLEILEQIIYETQKIKNNEDTEPETSI